MKDNEFNATPEGQRAMFWRSHDVAKTLLVNSRVRKMGGSCWEDKVIEQADPAFLKTIWEDAVSEYNRCIQLGLK